MISTVLTPCVKAGFLPSFSSLTPPAGETTQGEAGCEDFFNSLLGVS